MSDSQRQQEQQKRPGGPPGGDVGPPIVVQKYGGSSVATTERIMAVARRIKATVESGKRVCVVVSAMANTTDELLERARKISTAPPRRELDMLLSCGERASMALLSMAVAELGLEAISFTGSQCGIMTNDRHWGARIVDVRPFRVSDELERGRVVIVAGFQGVSYKREITTLGRGGSDTTAVALAAALGAEYCEICSDVDGVYTADPRIVEAAELIESISHDAMLELASHGAKVLHDAAIEYARHANIALWARGTSSDGRASDGGTRIDRPDASNDAGIGVAAQRGLLCVRLASREALERALTILTEASVRLAGLESTDSGGSITIDRDEAPDWPGVAQALEAALGDGHAIEERAAVSVVGGGLGRRPDAASRALAVASGASIAVASISSSPTRMTFGCAPGDVEKFTVLLHREFVERE